MNQQTTPSTFNINSHGYIIISPLSENLKKQIYVIQNKLANKFGKSVFWFPEKDQLHITFAHIISPDASYPVNPTILYENLSPTAIKTLDKITPETLNICVNFGTVEAHPSAIILKGHDDGSYDSIRRQFSDSITLPSQTRRPPNIIHSTIARFRQKIDLNTIQNFVEDFKLDQPEDLTELLLIHETKIYAQEYNIIKRFPHE